MADAFHITEMVTNKTVRSLIAQTFPQQTIRNVELLTGGLINTNLKVEFDSGYGPIVLRIYRDGSEVCRKEAAIHNLISAEIPVAKLIFASPATEDAPPYAIFEFVQGVTFQQLKRTLHAKATAQAAYSIGATLAAIGRFKFSKPGKLLTSGQELIVGESYIDGPNPIPRLIDRFLETAICQIRVGLNLTDRIHKFAWSSAGMVPDLDEKPSLVHSDYGNRNILVAEAEGVWKVAAVLDWEFGFSGSALLDVGNFLRYERFDRPLREPHFSEAFVSHGGMLPENWRDIVRLIDLSALVESLTHDDLPDDVEAEILELINATLQHRDPG